MKSKLLTTILFTFISFYGKSQCNPHVPANAAVVNADTTVNGAFDPLWVCSGIHLVSDGGFHNIFLEPGASMTTGGGIDTIYVKNGASFYMNGGIHVIYYENSNDVQIAGGIPTQYFCPVLTFDYTNAPSNGCALLLSAAFEPSDSIFCAGTCISFSDLSSNATSWQWSFPGASPSSSTDQNPQSICYNTAGTYDVTLIASNSSGSDTVTQYYSINVIPAGNPPTLSQSNDTLFSSQGFGTYQWYFNSVIINGATNYFYVATQTGLYTVEVVNDNGCESSSTISFVFTGIHESQVEASQLYVFPNPGNGKFDLQINSSYAGNVDVSITDLIGQKIVQETYVSSPGLNSLTFDISDQAAGVYFLTLTSKGNQYSRKLVIEH